VTYGPFYATKAYRLQGTDGSEEEILDHIRAKGLFSSFKLNRLSGLVTDPLNQIPARDWRSLKVRRIGPPKSTPNVQATDRSSFRVKLIGKSTPNPQATDRNTLGAPLPTTETPKGPTRPAELDEFEAPMPTLEVPQESTALQGPAESTIPPPAKCSRGQPTKHPESEGPLPSSEAPQESTVPQEPTEPAEPAFTLESLLTAHLRSVSRPHNLLTVRKSGSREGGLWRVWRTIWKRVWRAVWEEWEEVPYVF
jgi:hypothetical protein